MLCYFFFKYTAVTKIYTYRHTLSLHDALPIFKVPEHDRGVGEVQPVAPIGRRLAVRRGSEQAIFEAQLNASFAVGAWPVNGIDGFIQVEIVHKGDRKSTRLNSSH